MKKPKDKLRAMINDPDVRRFLRGIGMRDGAIRRLEDWEIQRNRKERRLDG